MSRLPTFERVAEPPPMRFTERDGRMLETIDRFDGFLADYQIGKLFFAGVNLRTVQDRLKLLYQNGYLERPTERQRASLSAMIYWLSEQGLMYVAGLRGEVPTALPKPPRWGMVQHDLAVNDVRIAITLACESVEATIEQWIPSKEFWAYPDEVRYSSIDGQRTESRRIRPDGYVALVYNKSRNRLLLEVDRATEDNPRFVREKIIPSIAYLRSDAYRVRFGANSGRWLVVTTSDLRISNMVRQAEAAVGAEARVFYFTTFDKALKTQNILTDAIWKRPGFTQLGALLGANSFDVAPNE